jgi:predicted TIM-barrel fold metal-dependent hydrolase
MIVDAHAHLGLDQVFDADFTAEALLAAQEANGIDVTLVQPATAHDLPTVQRYHDAIAELAARHPGRFRGIANPNPHLTGDDYARELERCVHGLGFVGVKLHPTAHALNPVGRDGRRAFELTRALGVPVMVHTGSGIPWSAPSLLGAAAQTYPDLPIVVAHAGGMILAGEAGQLAAAHPNVFLECSWVGGFHVLEWARELGAHRLLFGSDHGENAATELTKFRTAGLTAGELTWALGGTATKLFGL